MVVVVLMDYTRIVMYFHGNVLMRSHVYTDTAVCVISDMKCLFCDLTVF